MTNFVGTSLIHPPRMEPWASGVLATHLELNKEDAYHPLQKIKSTVDINQDDFYVRMEITLIYTRYANQSYQNGSVVLGMEDLRPRNVDSCDG